MKKKMKHEETKEKGHLDPHHKRRSRASLGMGMSNRAKAMSYHTNKIAKEVMHEHVPKGHGKVKKSTYESLKSIANENRHARNMELNSEAFRTKSKRASDKRKISKAYERRRGVRGNIIEIGKKHIGKGK